MSISLCGQKLVLTLVIGFLGRVIRFLDSGLVRRLVALCVLLLLLLVLQRLISLSRGRLDVVNLHV